MFNNEYPYTDFHELNLDFILKKTKELDQKVGSIAVVNNKFFEQRNAFYADKAEDINGRWYYVSVNGSDEYNDGLTPEKPVRTMRKAIELSSLYSNDVRVRIIAPGVYDVNYLVYACPGLHFAATCPDVILNYTNTGIHYMSHVNIAGMDDEHRLTIRCAHPNNLWYMDGGSAVFNNIIWDCTVRLNQAGATSYRCTFSSLLLFDSKFTLVYKTGFKNSTDSRGAIYLHNSDLFNTTPNLVCELDHDDPNPFLYARGSRIINTQVYTNETGYKWASADVGQGIYVSSTSSHSSLDDFVLDKQFNASNIISNVTLA